MEAETRMHQGRCSLPADGAGRVLDRLAGLEQVICPEHIQQALDAIRRGNSRKCTLTHEVILWVVLAWMPMQRSGRNFLERLPLGKAR